jgi:hypothetical protein
MIPASWATRPLQLFNGAPQVENFRSLGAIFPVRVIRRARTQSPLESDPATKLPDLFSFQRQTHQTKRFLDEMETTGLIVLKDDCIVFEQYWPGNDATTQTAAGTAISCVVGLFHRRRQFGIAGAGRRYARHEGTGCIRWNRSAPCRGARCA